MAVVSSIPGTVPHDGFVTVFTIKDTAKRSSNAYRGASVLSMITAARRAAEQGIQKEEAGDLQDALLKYYQVSHVLNNAMQASEYKQEASKHGAIWHEVVNFAKFFGEAVQPRLLDLEVRLQEVEARRAESARPSAQSTALNGNTTSRPILRQQSSDGDRPNETTGGSLADRMRKLQGAGLDVGTARTSTSIPNKRYSHQTTPSTSTSNSVSSSIPALSSQTSGDLHGSPSQPSSSLANTSSATSTSTVPSSSRTLGRDQGQSITISYSPAISMQSPTLSVGSPPFNSTAFSSLGQSRSPSSSPRFRQSEISRQGTGTSGITSSPRMHNLQNISSTPVEPKPAPRLTPSSSKPDPFSPLSPTSPSISQFATSFPAIEDLETSFQKTVLIDPSPSASDRQFPVFPSVPSIPVGARSGIPGPSLPSDSLQSTKGPSVPHDSSGVNGINRTSARPASMTSGLLKKQNSGGSSSGLRSQVTGGSSVPLKASTVLHPASQPSSGQFAMTSSQSTSLGRKPDIPITNSISPKTLIGYLDRRSNGGLQVLILDVRSREQFDRERIDSPATVCIEPSVLMRTSIDAMGVESALVLSPASEENSFRNREKFDVVVLHDEKSESFSSPLAKLNRIIYETEFTKLLQRPPMLLVGGLERWKKEIGLKGLVGHDIEAQLKAAEAREATAISSASSVRGVPNGHGSVSYSRPTNGQVSGYTQGSSTTSTDFRRPRSDSRSGNGGLPGDADTAEKERRRRAHVRDGAVFESSPLASTAGGEKTEQAEKGDEEPPARKSTLVRPSSSGAISAYNRPIPDTINGGIYTAHVPITYPSRVISPTATSPPSAFPPPSAYTSSMPQAATVLPPPQASLSGSPLSRRRSDYVEQSYFSYSGSTPGTMRASIDYPSLSAQNIVRYPPPVASTAMEKQGQRPRGHTASYSTQAASTSSTTLVNGKVIQDPPRIPCNYKVYYWSNAQVGMSGLRNLGNTCYMNSIVQCLSATVPFAQFFRDGRWKSAVNIKNPMGSNGAVAEAFANMVHDMWLGESTYLSPYGFRKSICAYAPQFSGSDQHDAQEFLSFLLDGLHEDLNRVLQKPSLPSPTPEREQELETLPQQIAGAQEWKLYRLRDDSLVVDWFQGQFRNRLTCLTCQKTSTTYNSFMYLSLPIPTRRGVSRVSLYECLDAFVKPEVMEKSDAWNCPHCKALRKATKQLSLSRMPPVLLIHLKRFSFKGPFTDKLETMVDFPIQDLDLTNYMPPLMPPNTAKSSTESYSPDDPRAQIPPYKYELYAVTNHFGSLSSGHYTAFIASKGGWVYCDDSRLSNAGPQDAVGRPAYILFYRRVKA